MNDDNPTPDASPASPHRSRLLMGLLVLVFSGAIGLWYQYVERPKSQPQPATASVSPQPSTSTVPAAVRISAGKTPAINFTLPSGFVAHVFAEDVANARDLAFSPGGTLLVSSPDKAKVTALPDADHNGAADSQKAVITGGTQIHGLAFYKSQLFVAERDSLKRYNWDESAQTATFDKTILNIPTNAGHINRTLTIAADGTLYLTIGSTCNVCRETVDGAATMLQSDINGANPHMYATGLRNAAFSALHPTTGEIWATENSRDNLGDNIPPDEVNIVRSGKNYGWPLCYGSNIHDTAFDKNTYVADPCSASELPAFQVPAHNAPLGLSFIKSSQFAKDQQGDLLVAYHGSWNRSVPDGYKVVRLKVQGNAITASEDFLTGFIGGPVVSGRPVDVSFDAAGNLYVSDDKAGAVYIIQHPTQS